LVWKFNWQSNKLVEMSATHSYFATFVLRDTVIHLSGAFQLVLCNTGLFDNSFFVLESWQMLSEFGRKEQNMGQARIISPFQHAHWIHSLEYRLWK
jgi:hypothetical protein